MRKEEIDALIQAKPFRPFEIRLIDGRKFRFRSPEQLIVSRSAIHTLDKKADPVIINLVLIASIHVRNGRGRQPEFKRL